MSGKPFRFEPLLDWAEQREDQQMLVLAAVLLEEQTAISTLDALADEREIALAQMSTLTRFDPEQRQAAEVYLQRMAQQIEAQRGVLEEVRGRVDVARSALIDLEREKQSLERLRDNDEAQALDEANRREASTVDDLNMTRHVRRTQGGSSGSRGAA